MDIFADLERAIKAAQTTQEIDDVLDSYVQDIAKNRTEFTQQEKARETYIYNMAKYQKALFRYEGHMSYSSENNTMQ